MQRKPAYAYVPRAIDDAFDEYAHQCGLTSKSELLSLLIRRELRLLRLPAAGQVRQSPSPGRTKITARLSEELDAALTAHVTALGVTISHAAALLVEGELEERWLEAALAWEPQT
jgi:hypothetical protein